MRKIYSDSFIHIERSDRIIEGLGFDSNEKLKEIIENENKNVIQMQDENGTKEYKKEYKIIYTGIAV